MLVPQDKTTVLKAFLGTLPGLVAARLAVAVEADRLMDGTSLPHDDILEGLRPVLRSGNFDRMPTPLRLFCRPFQDLLSSEQRTVKQKAVIRRTSLLPVWNWVCNELLPTQASAYTAECRALVLSHTVENAVACAAQFWQKAGAAITATLSKPTGRAGATKTLGDALAVEDAAEMGLLLSAGEMIEKLAAALPAPAPSFTEQLVWEARDVYDQVVANSPNVAPYIPVIAMNRLSKPWEALRLPMLVTRHSDETLISKTDMGLVGEILFERMDRLKDSIQIARHPIFDPQKLMDEVKTFADLSSHIVKEIELKRDGEWGKRLLAERVMIGEVMETFMDRALKEIDMALPMSKGTGAEFSRHPGVERHEMALRYARLVVGSREFAAAASFSAKQKVVYEKICAILKRYNEDLLKAMKGDPTHLVVRRSTSFVGNSRQSFLVSKKPRCCGVADGRRYPRLPNRWRLPSPGSWMEVQVTEQNAANRCKAVAFHKLEEGSLMLSPQLPSCPLKDPKFDLYSDLHLHLYALSVFNNLSSGSLISSDQITVIAGRGAAAVPEPLTISLFAAGRLALARSVAARRFSGFNSIDIEEWDAARSGAVFFAA